MRFILVYDRATSLENGLHTKTRHNLSLRGAMDTPQLAPTIGWMSPSDAAWLQSAAPNSLVERVCDGFRVAVWRLRRGAEPAAWLAATLQSGGVSFFDPPGSVEDLSSAQATSLLKFMVEQFCAQANLIQLMLPIGGEVTERAAIATGFQFGANLLLLGRSCSAAELGPVADPLRFEPCGRELELVLQRTYEGTLDCPLLTCKRPLEEVVRGYEATGSTGRTHWRTLFRNGEPAGCVLVAGHSKLAIAELVYMGLAPEARGKGLGGELLMEAERLTLECGFSQLVIGVDGANAPARRLYEAAGYAVWEEKRVFLWFPPPGTT
jgi:ribosomal protein S18 acetylase RimI-like enzyme